MEYLTRPFSLKCACHILDRGMNGEIDSYCRMYSTGGLRKKKYQVVSDPQGKRVCLMCRNVYARFNPTAGIQVRST